MIDQLLDDYYWKEIDFHLDRYEKVDPDYKYLAFPVRIGGFKSWAILTHCLFLDDISLAPKGLIMDGVTVTREEVRDWILSFADQICTDYMQSIKDDGGVCVSAGLITQPELDARIENIKHSKNVQDFITEHDNINEVRLQTLC